VGFTALQSDQTYTALPGDYFRYFTSSGGSFVTTDVIPAGAVIDFLGLGSCDPSGGSFFLYVYDVTDDGTVSTIGEVPSTAHGCTTEFNANALDHTVSGNTGHSIQVEVLQQDTAPTDGTARFSAVEIWWHRSVSPAPATPTFNDVPANHPFFQYIEALAASGITGGCHGSPPKYCPEAPVTRGQMAVFLAKALGLQFE